MMNDQSLDFNDRDYSDCEMISPELRSITLQPVQIRKEPDEPLKCKSFKDMRPDFGFLDQNSCGQRSFGKDFSKTTMLSQPSQGNSSCRPSFIRPRILTITNPLS